ncbi:LON peptidase substrate-binding domain-containing protein [Nitrospira sp. Kam-Ns4a]
MPIESDRPRPSEIAGFRVPARIPIFPLPNVVFFPRTYLPLHIFEPRYRSMITDAVGGGQCVGMALLKEGWEPEYDGNPPIHPVGCVGRLVSVERLPDGRYDIVLQGLSRYEVRQEIYEKPYREAVIELKPEAAAQTLPPAIRAELLALLADYLRACRRDLRWREHGRPEAPDDVLVNTIATVLDFTPLEKQFLLEADTLLRRARRAMDLIQFKLCQGDAAQGREC